MGESVTTTSSPGLPSLAATRSLLLVESSVPSAPATLTSAASPPRLARVGGSLGRDVNRQNRRKVQ